MLLSSVWNWGHTGKAVSNGDQVLEAIEKDHFDLMLLDLFLPDCTGYELIPRIHSITPNINIITMTGNNTRELELKVRQAGIIFYLIKPFELKALRLIIEHLSLKGTSSILSGLSALE